MRNLAFVIVVITFFPFICARSPQAAVDTRFQGVRKKVIGLVNDGRVVSISIAVAEDGKVVWEEAFGWSDLENRVRATPHTKYRLASIAKTITATALMTLVEKGQVHLDSSISEYLPGVKMRSFVGTEKDVTVRHLLNHRSGMPSYCELFFEDNPEGPRGLLETIKRYGIITFPPGGAFIYCNLGYELIGYLISQVSGIGYPRYVEENVFLPLGMTEASVYEWGGNVSQSAICYTPDFIPLPNYVASYPGASDIYCSAHDLISFAMYHLKNPVEDHTPILSDESIDAMQESYPPPNTTYGLGWRIDTNELGYRSVYHGGEGPGSDNFMRLIPSEEVAVVILCNTEYAGLGDLQEEICTVLIPEFGSMEKDETGAPLGEPEVPEGLLGIWRGEIIAYDKKIEAVLRVTETDGMRIAMANNQESIIDVSFSTDSFLFGSFPGVIPTSDAERHPERIRLVLVRHGDRLSGAATSNSWVEERQLRFELSSWIELTRR